MSTGPGALHRTSVTENGKATKFHVAPRRRWPLIGYVVGFRRLLAAMKGVAKAASSCTAGHAHRQDSVAGATAPEANCGDVCASLAWQCPTSTVTPCPFAAAGAGSGQVEERRHPKPKR